MRTLTMLKVPAGFIAAVLAVASLAPDGQHRLARHQRRSLGFRGRKERRRIVLVLPL